MIWAENKFFTDTSQATEGVVIKGKVTSIRVILKQKKLYSIVFGKKRGTNEYRQNLVIISEELSLYNLH